MKRIFLSVIIFCFFILPAVAIEYIPRYNTSIKNYGIGLYFGEGKATVYEQPDENSPILAQISWDANKVLINKEVFEPKNIFAVFLPKNGLSGFIAIGEQNEEYTEIIYDNTKQLTGWIKNSPENKVFYWRQIFYRYGKTKGLNLFANMPKEEKVLKLSPDENSENSYSFIYPKFIRLQLIKGNWALLKVVDYDNEQKVGWFKWRNLDGTLNIYPNFKG